MNASTMLFRVPGIGDVGAAGAPRTPRKALLSCWEQQGVMMRFQVVVEDEEEEMEVWIGEGNEMVEETSIIEVKERETVKRQFVVSETACRIRMPVVLTED